MNIAISNICTAFNYGGAIGSRVSPSYEPDFIWLVRDAIEREVEEHGVEYSPVMVLRLPEAANRMVRCGVGMVPALASASDFTIREYRGKWGMYLKPEHAMPTKRVDVVVYTKREYDNDPDSTPEETERTKDADYVIVAVLANPSEEKPPYGSTVLVHNIAGGNNAFKVGPVPSIIRPEDADEWVESEQARLYRWFMKLARETEFAEQHYRTVADPE